MKIIIEHDHVKRELSGTGFNICGSREDLMRITETIQSHIIGTSFGYGWIKVRDDGLDEHSAGPNSETRPWAYH